MIVKTAGLADTALDWAVVKCEKLDWCQDKDSYGKVTGILVKEGPELVYYTPSRSWGRGGQIIERQKIDIAHLQDGCVAYMYFSNDDDDILQRNEQRGETPLIAAMRCYVASKLGDEIEVPDDLL